MERVLRGRFYQPSQDMVAIWACYYHLTEQYDKAVCTARSSDGPLPRNAYEYGLSVRYATCVLDVIKRLCRQIGEPFDTSVRDSVLRMSDKQIEEMALGSPYLGQIRDGLRKHADQTWQVNERLKEKAFVF